MINEIKCDGPSNRPNQPPPSPKKNTSEIDNGTLNTDEQTRQIMIDRFREYIPELLLKELYAPSTDEIRRYAIPPPSWARELWICFKGTESWFEILPIKPVEYITLNLRVTKTGANIVPIEDQE